ncbi:MAG TPA: dihydrofolate reductase family protein [Thermoplasmata archaeon]|jgi:dihydrofolate reductase|nr:dihydrofolate reductase family protein [Thermoplasmata archaeon]
MKTSVFVGASVDGFIARENGSLDFLMMGENLDNGFEAFVATIDAQVIGRKTFDWARGWLRGHPGQWPFEKPLFVLTRHPQRLSIPNGVTCEVLNGTPQQVVSHLGRRGFRHLYVDGGKTIQGFLRAGRVDRLIVTRVPVLIGEGIPLFGALPHDVRLKHIRTKVYRKGLVQTEYRVLPR